MALANSTIWEVRTTGADTNGGGYHWDSPLIPTVATVLTSGGTVSGSIPAGVTVSGFVTFTDSAGANTVAGPLSNSFTVSGVTLTNRVTYSKPTNPTAVNSITAASWGVYVSVNGGPYWLYTQGIPLATTTFNIQAIPPVPPTSGLSVPAALSCVGSGTGGSMSPGNWYFTAAYIDGSGNYTDVGTATLVTTTGSTSSVSITPPTQGSAVSWTLFGGTSINGPFWTLKSKITDFSTTVVNQFNANGSTLQQARGTDYSTQNSPQLSLSDIVCNAGSQEISSVTGGFTNLMVGNIIQLQGTNAGFYEIIAQQSSNLAWLDRNLTNSATGVSGKVGGALTLYGASQTQATSGPGGNKVYVMGGNYNLSTNGNDSGGFTFNNPNVSPGSSANNQPFTIEGYYQTRGDLGVGPGGADDRPVITLNAATTAINPSVFRFVNSGIQLSNLIVNCSGVTGSIGFNTPVNQGRIQNCKVSNFGSSGIFCTSAGQTLLIMNNEITGGISGATAAISSTSSNPTVFWCNIHNNACSGIKSPGIIAISNLIYGNTGATSDGYTASAVGQAILINNTVDSNGRYGFNMSVSSTVQGSIFKNNLITNNTLQGLAFGTSPGVPFGYFCDNNAYYNNNSSLVYNSQITFPTNPEGINQVGTWVSNDKTLTTSPYNAGSGNYTLNNVPNAGQACIGTGVINLYPGDTNTSNLDIGAYQVPATSGGSLIGISVPRLIGGI